MSELGTILKHDGKNTAINLKMANEQSEFAAVPGADDRARLARRGVPWNYITMYVPTGKSVRPRGMSANSRGVLVTSQTNDPHPASRTLALSAKSAHTTRTLSRHFLYFTSIYYFTFFCIIQARRVEME